MSLDGGGRYIFCDGEDCTARTAVPVALCPTHSRAGQTVPADPGWLYVLRQNASHHYCPECARRHLQSHCDDSEI